MKKNINHQQLSCDFLDYIKKGITPYHVIKNNEKYLLEEGFQLLDFSKEWEVLPAGNYYTIPYGTAMFIFKIPKELRKDSIFRMTASHTDYPCFRIKPNPEMREKGYLKLNVETYGGAILNTWLDRPLSVAGKVTLASEKVFEPTITLLDVKRPVLTIPNLAIHMNRNVNSGVELNKQLDMLPLYGMCEEETDEEFFLSFLAKELNVKKEDILDFDLYVYNYEEPCILGGKNEFYSAPRLDNLTSVYASLKAIIESKNHTQDILISACYDNEEIGSKTKQGADSFLTTLFLKKLFHAVSTSKPGDFETMLMNSFLISSDVAHGYHPNHGEKNDVSNYTKLNQGVVIKLNWNQRYATDTEAIGIIQQICEQYEIPYQKFVNRSDLPGGGTLGSILSSWLPMKTVDLGIPLLAMHSARELGGVQDEIALIQLLLAFYQCQR